mmetsp:Transcript_30623/g.85846  ORF Transcript_30623/g.85846 Transcript_30623/m.85846 type:complete len:201 (-) Transcript_30623:1013-1615(-)
MVALPMRALLVGQAIQRPIEVGDEIGLTSHDCIPEQEAQQGPGATAALIVRAHEDIRTQAELQRLQRLQTMRHAIAFAGVRGNARQIPAKGERKLRKNQPQDCTSLRRHGAPLVAEARPHHAIVPTDAAPVGEALQGRAQATSASWQCDLRPFENSHSLHLLVPSPTSASNSHLRNSAQRAVDGNEDFVSLAVLILAIPT